MLRDAAESVRECRKLERIRAEKVEESHVEESHVEESHVEESHVEESHVEESHVEESHVQQFGVGCLASMSGDCCGGCNVLVSTLIALQPSARQPISAPPSR